MASKTTPPQLDKWNFHVHVDAPGQWDKKQAFAQNNRGSVKTVFLIVEEGQGT